jgi:cell division protease FtsH
MYVGVGAARVREIFKKAREVAPSVIFIDELDAMGRRFGNTNGDSQTLNQMLTEMDGFESGKDNKGKSVIVLAATNRPESLDPALKRPGRFDRQVTVDMPDAKGRLAVLGVHARQSGVRLQPGTDLQLIARRTMGFSGAGLQGLLNEAALLAAREQSAAVGPTHMLEGIERVVGGLKRASVLLPVRERLTVAIHECGHALVGAAVAAERARLEQAMCERDEWFARTLERAEANLRGAEGGAEGVAKRAAPRLAGLPTKVSIVPRGSAAAGYTLTIPEEDRFLYTEEELRGQVFISVPLVSRVHAHHPGGGPLPLHGGGTARPGIHISATCQ